MVMCDTAIVVHKSLFRALMAPYEKLKKESKVYSATYQDFQRALAKERELNRKQDSVCNAYNVELNAQIRERDVLFAITLDSLNRIGKQAQAKVNKSMDYIEEIKKEQVEEWNKWTKQERLRRYFWTVGGVSVGIGIGCLIGFFAR